MKTNRRLIEFDKLNGAGNDFIIIDTGQSNFSRNYKALFGGTSRSRFAQQICRRNASLGADGVVFIERTKEKDINFSWDFYNSDGSKARMCGNASRCVVRWAVSKGVALRRLVFKTQSGLIEGELLKNEESRVKMAQVKIIEASVKLKIKKKSISGTYIDAGVPQFVVERKNLENWDELREIGKKIRWHKTFPEGTNVSFIKKVSSKEIQVVSFERGIENLTLACGTGAAASALCFCMKNKITKIKVNMPGGQIKVSFSKDFEQTWIQGHTSWSATGFLCKESIL